MILIDREIRIALKEGSVVIEPQPNLEIAVSSTSIDLTLSDTFKTWKTLPGMTISPGKSS